MMKALIPLLFALIALQGSQASDPNDSASPPVGSPAGHRPLDLKVFNNMDQPLTGFWDLEIPQTPPRRIEMKAPEAGPSNALIGVDQASHEEILRITRKKEGLGYEGQLQKVFGACGIDTLSISEFLPLGEVAVIRFETRPTSMPCPPIDSGRAGRFFAVSRGGGPVRLRDFGEISSTGVRETYSIGGDRPNAEKTSEFPIGAVSVDDGTELRFLQRVKAPLDGAYWFQMEAVLAPGSQVKPPRGYIPADQMRFVGSLTLRRVSGREVPARPEPAPGSK